MNGTRIRKKLGRLFSIQQTPKEIAMAIAIKVFARLREGPCNE
jgi:hypothetical protein